MKIIEIPGIGDICNIDISEVRNKLSEESQRHKVIADSMKQINTYLRYIENYSKKIRDALGEAEPESDEECSTKTFKSIHLKGFQGKWSEIDSYSGHDDTRYVLMKNDMIGNETAYVLCYVIEDRLVLICETRDDIVTALRSLGIIE